MKLHPYGLRRQAKRDAALGAHDNLSATGKAPSPLRSAGARQNGSVLIIVLWITLGLVAIALYFANSMTFELRASDNRVSMLAADQAIEGAARYVSNVLTNQATNGIVPFPYDYASEAVAVGNATDDRANAHFWLIGRSDNQSSLVAQDQMAFGLVDEASKLNLNTASAEMLEALRVSPMAEALIPAEFAAAIVDWRDADEDLTSGGAENETYARLRPSYLCKNGPFDSVDELRLVSGASWLALMGGDLNRNGVLEPNEQVNNPTGLADPGILEYVTVFSREPNTRADGSPRVNVNGNPQELRTLLEDTFGSARAGQIVPPPGPSGSVLEFFTRSGLTEAEFIQIEADITTSTNSVIEGRVNVNTASAAVLACIPGIGEDKAIELVNYRLANTDTINSVAWVRNILTSADEIRAAGPFLTGQTYVFSADIAALGPFGRGYRRTRFVYDLTEGVPKIIYRQNLSHLGWALGRETREEWLATATP